MVKIDIIIVTSSRVRWVRHTKVGETIFPDSEESVQENIGLVRVVKLPVPPGNEYPACNVVQRLL